jgi:predicted MFS family arabinose efflux permease
VTVRADAVVAQQDRSDPRLVVFTLWLLVFGVGSQAMLIAPIIPQIATQLSIEEAALGTLITAYSVAVGAFALLVGPISDRVGRRPVLLAGTGLMTGALALHWFAGDFLGLFGVRLLAGVAGGVLNGAAIAYVGDYFPPERRGWANGWVISGFAAGQIAGIPIGTLLASEFGFRAPFLAFAVATLLAFGLVVVYLPAPGVTLATSKLTVRSFLGEYAALLRRREILAATLVFFLMFGGSALYTTFLPTWLQVELLVGAGAIALLFLVGGLSNAVVGPVAGSLSDSLGRKRIILVASVGIAVTMAVTPVAGAVGGFVAVAGVFVVVMALFASRASSFTTLLTELADGNQRGALMSLTVGVGQVGTGIGGALAGTAYAATGYPASAVAAGVLMAVITLLIYVYLPATGPGARRPTPRADGSSLVDTNGDGRPDIACDALCGPTAEGGYSDGDD